jgi:hypothetical protein
MAGLDEHAGSYKLAFEEGARALDARERAVNELRSRAGVLVASAAVMTSFFGSRAVIGGELKPASWVAIIAFSLVAATVLGVLWPWRDWEFSADAEDMIATYIETPIPASLAEMHRDMALHRAASYVFNAKLLGRLFWAVRAGVALVAAEACAWIVAVSGSG